MKPKQIIPYFSMDNPYDVVYRNSSTSFPVKPHTHNALEIYFTLTNLPNVLLNDTVSSVSKGSLIVIPPHYVHQLFNQNLTVYERYIITINSNWLNTVLDKQTELMSYASYTSLPTIVRLSNSDISILCDKLDNYLQNHSTSSLSRYADFFSILSILDAAITKGLNKNLSVKLSISQSQKNVNEIISFINKHLTEPLTLDTIAANFYLNKDYLGRLFKEHTHATIGHYISVQRASLAQNMLAEGQTVSEVQEKLGFSSYSYFFKFFKKMTGISPSQYRKNNILD
ncbi:MAG: helix-turn-helix domain-containing protein [Cellulosilyticum sp.]|nr:helix-turn-helix domain-containing protein [Cellulosilyticum sp.]